MRTLHQSALSASNGSKVAYIKARLAYILIGLAVRVSPEIKEGMIAVADFVNKETD